MLTRRQFAIGSALAASVVSSFRTALAQQNSDASKSDTHGHDMPAHWTGKEQIAFLIYPEFTALDMVGPHYMFTSLMGATTHVVAKSKDVVRSDTGLLFSPTATYDECPADLDIICIPGGSSGTLAAMKDEATLRFVKDRGSRAKYVTSVCTGSLILGAAGLLNGYKATSHWVAKDLLKIFGAVPSDGRVVIDRNRITGGGVTAGIDFGLTLVQKLRDTKYAQAVQLLAEYSPEPPLNAGRPDLAPADVKTMMEEMFVDFLQQADSIGKESFAKARAL